MGDNPYTPEVVAGGRHAGVGQSTAAVAALIARARTPHLTQVAFADRTARIGAGVAPKGGADFKKKVEGEAEGDAPSSASMSRAEMVHEDKSSNLGSATDMKPSAKEA